MNGESAFVGACVGCGLWGAGRFSLIRGELWPKILSGKENDKICRPRTRHEKVSSFVRVTRRTSSVLGSPSASAILRYLSHGLSCPVRAFQCVPLHGNGWKNENAPDKENRVASKEKNAPSFLPCCLGGQVRPSPRRLILSLSRTRYLICVSVFVACVT